MAAPAASATPSTSSLAAAFLPVNHTNAAISTAPSPVLGHLDAAATMSVVPSPPSLHAAMYHHAVQQQQQHPQQQHHLFPGQSQVHFAYPSQPQYSNTSQPQGQQSLTQQFPAVSQQDLQQHNLALHQQQQQLHTHQAHQQQQLYAVQSGSFRVPLPPRQFVTSGPVELQQPNGQTAASLEDRTRVNTLQRSQSLNSIYHPYPDSQPHAHPGAYSPFGPGFQGYPASAGDFGGFAASPSPLVRYGSYDMMSNANAVAGPSRGAMQPEQANIDQLLAMSKAQAEVAGDANMFACPHCEKTYTGRHARSIWRRHLQDKHNIPLSIQPRRTRWDGDANRPKNAEERRARMLESKRRWARKKRQQEKLAQGKGVDGAAANEAVGDSSYDDGAEADTSNMTGDDSFMFGAGELKENHSPEQHSAAALHQSPWNGADAKLSHAKWASPSRRVSEANPFLVQGAQHYEQQMAAAGGLKGAAALSMTPLNRNAHLYPTPPSSGTPSQVPAGFPGAHLYSSSSPMRKAMSASAQMDANGSRASHALPLLSPPASDERATAIAYQQRTRSSAAAATFSGLGSFEGVAAHDGYLAPNGGALASGISRGSGDSVAATSVATPTSATFFPGMPMPALAAASGLQTQQALPGRKTDQQEAAIQLLALRSNSNSPSDADAQGTRKRRHASMNEPWDTPSKTRISPSNSKMRTEASYGLTRPSPSPRSKSSTSVPSIGAGLLDDATEMLDAAGGPRRRSEPRDTPSKATNTATSLSSRQAGDSSPTPATRSLPPAVAGVAASSSAVLLSLSTPGPSTRSGSNPFSLNKHKISPFEGKRRLSFGAKDKLYDAFGGELVPSPVASPIRVGGPLSLAGLGPDSASMEKSASTQSNASDGSSILGPRLPPLVSTPVRPGDGMSAIRGTAKALYDDDADTVQHAGAVRGKFGRDILPPPLSTSKRVGLVSTPFSKPPAASGLSVLRLGATALKTGSLSRPSPSKLGGDQFSSPQHLNLTESLGLAPHSISRSSYASLYGGSLGLTPSISALGGLTPGLTSFNTPFGAWPESARKALAADEDDDDEDLENKPRGDEAVLEAKLGRRAARGMSHDETPSKPSNAQRRKLQPLSLSLAGNLDS